MDEELREELDEMWERIRELEKQLDNELAPDEELDFDFDL